MKPFAQWAGPGVLRAGARLTRRDLVKLAGATLGAGGAMNVLAAWGQIPVPDKYSPPGLGGSGEGTRIVVLGAGPGGCVAAWELIKAGYDVTVIEARDRLGGHVFTVRGGSTTTEYGKGEQVCDWDDDAMWFDAGPSRIPFFHRGILHYAREFNVPLITHQNLSLNGYLYAEGIPGRLNGQRIRLRELQADMAGYTSELLAKAIHQGGLDDDVTAEDRELLIDYLVNWGILSPDDLAYHGSSHRGYTRAPGVLQPPGHDAAYPLEDLLPFAAAIVSEQAGYLASTAYFDWQSTLLKPKRGMSQLYEEGFAPVLGDRVRLRCEVTGIRQDDRGVRITYLNQETGQTGHVEADYCLCNIPLSVLIKIPADFSPAFTDAIRSVSYGMANRTGLGFHRRFWEEDDWIYGGQSFLTMPEIHVIHYPDDNFGARKGVLLCGYSVDEHAARVSSLPYGERVALMLDQASKIHPQMRDEFMSGFSVSWHLQPYSLGAWAEYTEETRADAYPRLVEPDGRVYLVGEHLSYFWGWMEGAVQSAWFQIERLHERVRQSA